MNSLVTTLILGTGATAVMDVWGIARQRLFDIAAPNYGLVGRWIGHMPRGRFRHASIAKAATIRGERLLGWSAHYLIGIAYAGLLVLMVGAEWIRQPTLWPAMAVGIGTVAAPFLLMQPGMGAGIAASRTPRPGAARMQSLIMHAVFGLGLYVTGWAIQLVYSI